MTDREGRPVPVGNYEVLQDHEWPTASIRVLRILKGAPIQSHVHQRSMQIYLAVQGRSRVSIDGVEHVLSPYEAAAVWASSIHSATAEGPESILLNISVPPLAEDDQLHALPASETDMRLPTEADDVED